jgi:hypothetical protein
MHDVQEVHEVEEAKGLGPLRALPALAAREQ